MANVIHWALCKKLKTDYTNKWYMHNPESVLENEMQTLLWDFEIQTNQLIPARRPDRVIIKKENLPNSERYRPGRQKSKIKKRQKERLVPIYCSNRVKWGMRELIEKNLKMILVV